MSSSIENLRYALEWLLAGSVPNLKLKDWLIIAVAHFKKEWSELYSHGDLMILTELICGHSVHKAGFTDTWVTDYNQFE